MTELDRRQNQSETAFGAITQSLVEKEGFQKDLLGKNTENALNYLMPRMGLLTPSGHVDLGVLIINGLSLGTQLWNAQTREAALTIFPRINFSDMDENALTSIKDSYIHAVYMQKGIVDSQESAQSLLQVGRFLTPHLVKKTPPTMVGEIDQVWDIATADKDITWQTVASQANEITNELAMQFIESLSTKTALRGRSFRPTVMERRKAVYKLPTQVDAKQGASIIASTTGIQATDITVGQDRAWLIKNGLLKKKYKGEGKRTTREELEQEIEEIIEHGLTDPSKELQRILRLYLQGVPSQRIPKNVGSSPYTRIKTLEEAGVIPDRRTIDFIRAFAAYKIGPKRRYSDEQIAEMCDIPPRVVKLILSVPVNKHALEELASEITIFEA